MQNSFFQTESLASLVENYDDFVVASRIKINRYLNAVLWFCTISGPAIALGVRAGIFAAINYGICVFITVYVAIVAFINLLIIKRWPESRASGMFALLAMDALLVMMAYAHVGIYLTWFIVPLLSLLFMDRRVFIAAVAVNYCFMIFSTYLISPYYSGLRIDHDVPSTYFISYVGGFTIETIMMTAAAVVLGRVVISYFSNLVDNYQKLNLHKEQLIRDEKKIKDDMVMLESMAGIYENVNLLDFNKNTETPLHDAEHLTRSFDLSRQTQTFMNSQLDHDVVDSLLDDFMTFTDITTIQGRLAGKKVIAKEFMNKNTGWFRAQYINIEPTIEGTPNRIIYTVQNIDRDKRKEERLIRISITDELTGLYNRRCFDNDIEDYLQGPIADDLVLISIDVNGLKTANDTLGHSAGDELIKGAAFCSQLAFGTYGRVYRTGGDEFVAMIHSDDCDFIQDTLNMMANEWTGKEVDSLSLSVGYAAHKDYPDKSIPELSKIADAMMYEEKEKYYTKTGKIRRTQ